ncbi:unnamed protein product [Phytomonas sp. EM1]|nr:unnamed protein product [Phytomonas sp. EM1]|eukprot:CCW60464.1 unnamed protein product [Phytomonas sp. isolate EM1]
MKYANEWYKIYKSGGGGGMRRFVMFISLHLYHPFVCLLSDIWSFFLFKQFASSHHTLINWYTFQRQVIFSLQPSRWQMQGKKVFKFLS